DSVGAMRHGISQVRSSTPLSRKRERGVNGSGVEQFGCGFQDIFDGKAEFLEQRRSRGRLTEGGHADDATFQTHILVPIVGMRGFDGDPRTDLQRQYGLTVSGILLI